VGAHPPLGFRPLAPEDGVGDPAVLAERGVGPLADGEGHLAQALDLARERLVHGPQPPVAGEIEDRLVVDVVVGGLLAQLVEEGA
jgi:hypothetical protein